MNHRAYVGLVAILAIFVLALTPTTTYAEAQPGTQMQEFQLQALDNKLYGTQGAEGKISILFFMGHNCDPCIGAAPAVEANIYQQVRTKPNVQMMGLDVWNGNVGELTLFRTITGVTFPLLKAAAQENLTYSGAVLEDLVVVDQTGIVRLSIDSASEQDHFKVTDMVESLLSTTPIVSLSLRSIYYGMTMNLGDTKTLNLDIQNTGAGALDITGFNSTVSGLVIDPPTVSIAAFETERVKIVFTPSESGTYSGNITLEHNNSNVGALQLALSDIAVEGSVLPSIALAQQSITLGELEVGKSMIQTLTVTNGGPGQLDNILAKYRRLLSLALETGNRRFVPTFRQPQRSGIPKKDCPIFFYCSKR